MLRVGRAVARLTGRLCALCKCAMPTNRLLYEMGHVLPKLRLVGLYELVCAEDDLAMGGRAPANW